MHQDALRLTEIEQDKPRKLFDIVNSSNFYPRAPVVRFVIFYVLRIYIEKMNIYVFLHNRQIGGRSHGWLFDSGR